MQLRRASAAVVASVAVEIAASAPVRRNVPAKRRVSGEFEAGGRRTAPARHKAAGCRAARLTRMTIIDEQGRPEPPLAGDEAATLLGFLDFQRATLAWKCAGLDAAGFGATAAASSMTLGGLLKHMAYVESAWFSHSLHARDREAPFDTVDWKANPDWEWHSAAGDTPDQLRTLWQDAVDRSRIRVAEALAGGGLDQLARRPVGRRFGAEPALDPVPHDRGVCPAQRPRRPPPRGLGRRDGGVAAGRVDACGCRCGPHVRRRVVARLSTPPTTRCAISQGGFGRFWTPNDDQD